MNKESYLQYIAIMLHMEKTLQMQSDAIQKLRQMATGIHCVGREVAQPDIRYIPPRKDNISYRRYLKVTAVGWAILAVILIIASLVVHCHVHYEILFIRFFSNFISFIPILGLYIATIVICVIAIIKAKELPELLEHNTNERRRDQKYNEKQRKDYERNLKTESCRLLDERKRKIYLLRMIDQLDHIHTETEIRRDRFYDVGILYPKYRTIEYMTKIYELLDSGICDELTGPNGAYDKAENKLFQDKVLTKMDTIILNQEKMIEVISRDQRRLDRIITDIRSDINEIQQKMQISAAEELSAYESDCSDLETSYEQTISSFKKNHIP